MITLNNNRKYRRQSISITVSGNQYTLLLLLKHNYGRNNMSQRPFASLPPIKSSTSPKEKESPHKVTHQASPRLPLRDNLKTRWSSLSFHKIKDFHPSTTKPNHFAGTTEDDTEFYSEDYGELDFVNGSLWFIGDRVGHVSMHSPPFPKKNLLICGVEDWSYNSASTSSSSSSNDMEIDTASYLVTPNKKLTRWFYCSTQFLRLWHLIMHGEKSSVFETACRENIISDLITSEPHNVYQESIAIHYQHVYCIVAYVFYYNIALNSPQFEVFVSFPKKGVVSPRIITPMHDYISNLLLHFGAVG
jgi:hypothetical protein